MRCTALLLATVALALPAQEAFIGARVHGLLPMGDLRDLTDSQIGLGAAAFVSIPVSGGLVLRPLVGAQLLPKGDTLGVAGTKTSVASVDLMLDALWFPDQDPERGAYLVGSVGAQQWRVSAVGSSPSSLSATRLGTEWWPGLPVHPAPRHRGPGLLEPHRQVHHRHGPHGRGDDAVLARAARAS